MIILLNKNLDCETLCKKISKFIKTELSDEKDLSNYALSITISNIYDEVKTNNIEFNETLLNKK